MVIDEEQLRRLWEGASKVYVDLGTFEEFLEKMQSEEKQEEFYNAASTKFSDLGTLDEFKAKINPPPSEDAVQEHQGYDEVERLEVESLEDERLEVEEEPSNEYYQRFAELVEQEGVEEQRLKVAEHAKAEFFKDKTGRLTGTRVKYQKPIDEIEGILENIAKAKSELVQKEMEKRTPGFWEARYADNELGYNYKAHTELKLKFSLNQQKRGDRKKLNEFNRQQVELEGVILKAFQKDVNEQFDVLDEQYKPLKDRVSEIKNQLTGLRWEHEAGIEFTEQKKEYYAQLVQEYKQLVEETKPIIGQQTILRGQSMMQQAQYLKTHSDVALFDYGLDNMAENKLVNLFKSWTIQSVGWISDMADPILGDNMPLLFPNAPISYVDGEVRGDVLNNLSKEIAQEYVSPMKYDTGFFDNESINTVEDFLLKYTSKTFEILATAVPMVGASVLSGGSAIPAGILGTMMYGSDVYFDLKENAPEMPEGERTAISIVTGLAAGTIDGLVSARLSKAFLGRLTADASLIRSVGKSKGIPSIKLFEPNKKGWVQTINELSTDIAISGTGEFLEETIVAASKLLAQDIEQDRGHQAYISKDGINLLSAKTIWNQLKESAYMGGFAGLLIGGTGRAISGKGLANFDLINQLYKEPELKEAFDSQLDLMLKTNMLTKEQHEQTKNMVDNTIYVISTMPVDVVNSKLLTPEAKSNIVKLIEQRDEIIKDNIEGKDLELAKTFKEKVDDLNKEIAELAKEKEQAPVKSDKSKKDVTEPEPIEPDREVDELTDVVRISGVARISKSLKQVFPEVEVIIDQQVWDETVPKEAKNNLAFFDSKGRVVYNPNEVTSRTPFHEFGHLWVAAIRQKNNPLYEKLIELIQGTELQQETVSEIGKFENGVLTNTRIVNDEVIAKLLGKKGLDVFQDKAKQSTFRKLYNQFIDWLRKFFGLSAEYNLETATLDDLLNVGAKDLNRGKRSEYIKNKAEFQEVLKGEFDQATYNEGIPIEVQQRVQYRVNHTAPRPEGANSLDNITDVFPEDIYGEQGVRYYGTGDIKADKRVIKIIKAMRGNPEKEVTIYRAVPKDITTVNSGDWVTLDKEYAEQHGYDPNDSSKDMPVISKKVKAKELFTDGNSIFEWGYHPSEGVETKPTVFNLDAKDPKVQFALHTLKTENFPKTGDRGIDGRINYKGLRTSELRQAQRNLAEGKESKALQRTLDVLMEMYERGSVDIIQGRGGQTNYTGVPINERVAAEPELQNKMPELQGESKKVEVYRHKHIPSMTFEVTGETSKGFKGVQKDPNSLSKLERTKGKQVSYSSSDLKELFNKDEAKGGDARFAKGSKVNTPIKWKKNIGDEGWSSNMENEVAADNQGGYISEDGDYTIYQDVRFKDVDGYSRAYRSGYWTADYKDKPLTRKMVYGNEFEGEAFWFPTLKDAKNFVNNHVEKQLAKGGDKRYSKGDVSVNTSIPKDVGTQFQSIDRYFLPSEEASVKDLKNNSENEYLRVKLYRKTALDLVKTPYFTKADARKNFNKYLSVSDVIIKKEKGAFRAYTKGDLVNWITQGSSYEQVSERVLETDEFWESLVSKVLLKSGLEKVPSRAYADMAHHLAANYESFKNKNYKKNKHVYPESAYDMSNMSVEDIYPESKNPHLYTDSYITSGGKKFLSLTGQDATLIFRGINGSELKAIIKNGYIQSNQSYNLGDEVEAGLTVYASNPRTAIHYASSFAPLQFRPTKGNPNYIITIENNPSITQTVTDVIDGYIKTPNKIPSNKIFDIWSVDENGEVKNVREKFLSDLFDNSIKDTKPLDVRFSKGDEDPKTNKGDKYLPTLKPGEKIRSFYQRYANDPSFSEDVYNYLDTDAKKYITKPNLLTKSEALAIIEKLGLEKAHKLALSAELQPRVKIGLGAEVIKAYDKLIEQESSKEKKDEYAELSAELIYELGKQLTKWGQGIQYARNMFASMSQHTIVKTLEKQLDRELTSKEQKQFIKLAKEVDKAPEGSRKNKAINKLSKEVLLLENIERSELIQSIWYAHLLSGVPTHVRNITGTLWMLVSEQLPEMFRDPKRWYHSLPGAVEGAKKGWDEMTNIWKTGESAVKASSDMTLNKYAHNSNIFEIVDLKGGAYKVLKKHKYVTRGLLAVDAFFYNINTEQKYFQLAYSYAKKMGNKDVVKSMEKYLNNENDKVKSFFEQAKQEGLKGRDARRRVYDLISEGRPDQWHDLADKHASYAVFTNKPTGSLGYMVEGFESFARANKLMNTIRYIVPFVRIVSNVTNAYLNYTPLGAIRAAHGKSSIIHAFDSEVNVTLSKEERVKLLIRSGIGMTLIGLMALLLEEDLIKITADGADNREKNYQLKKGGWEPYTISIGKWKMSYIDTPMFFMLAGLGAIEDYKNYGRESKEGELRLWKWLSVYASGAIHSTLDTSWLVNISEVLTPSTKGRHRYDTEEVVTRFLKVGGNVALPFFMPAFFTQTARAVQDFTGNPIKSAHGLHQKFIRDIPYARQVLRNITDALGDDVEPRALDRWLPLRIMKERVDPLTLRLNNMNLYVTRPPRKEVIDAFSRKVREMTNKEYADYYRESGKAIKDKLLSNKSSFLNALEKPENLEKRGEMFTNMKQAIRKKVYKKMFIETK
jgi:hypothetical protein